MNTSQMVTIKTALIVDWDPSPEVYQRLVERLHALDRERIVRYRRRSDRLCFLVGRLLLLKLVEEQLYDARISQQRDPVTQMILGYNSFGKPFLVHPQWQDYELEFNITHDDTVVMVAAYMHAKQRKEGAGLGVDIMQMDRRDSDAEGIEDVLLEQLHPSELSDFRKQFPFKTSSQMNNETSTARLNYLIRMWTAKEAYTKAIGTGLSMEFAKISLLGLDQLNKGPFIIRLAQETAPGKLQIESAAHATLALAPPVNIDWNIESGTLVLDPTSAKGENTVLPSRFAWSIATPTLLGAELKFEVVETKDLEVMAVTDSSALDQTNNEAG